jgi:methylphosphotriester-DNA--protein-cysteine methyltransferase
MLHHIDLGKTISERKRNMKQLVKQGEIAWGGNKKLKIYGTLNCNSGKRMKIENRVFFSSETEAIENGFRPCGNCMKQKYQHGKDGFI